jgi:hypothetical protein
MGVVILLTVLTNFSNARFPNPLLEVFPQFRQFLLRQQASVAYAATLSIISVLPILLAVWIAADYLKRESDEFIRMLVVRALLWASRSRWQGMRLLVSSRWCIRDRSPLLS